MSSTVRCRGCGKPMTRKAWYAHREHCLKCPACGHSVVMKVAGCTCCEWRPA